MVYTILWIVWGLTFAVVERQALANKTEGDTLSEHVWKVFNVKTPVDGRKRGGWDYKRFGLAAFMVWLTGHLVMGWWAG